MMRNYFIKVHNIIRLFLWLQTNPCTLAFFAPLLRVIAVNAFVIVSSLHSAQLRTTVFTFFHTLVTISSGATKTSFKVPRQQHANTAAIARLKLFRRSVL